MKRVDSVIVAFLFLMPALAGCLENEKIEGIMADDIDVNPETMIAGEFQPLTITAKRDVSVFIPHMIVDSVSNYVQNGTVIDMKMGETEQLTVLAPPRLSLIHI